MLMPTKTALARNNPRWFDENGPMIPPNPPATKVVGATMTASIGPATKNAAIASRVPSAARMASAPEMSATINAAAKVPIATPAGTPAKTPTAILATVFMPGSSSADRVNVAILGRLQAYLTFVYSHIQRGDAQ